MTSVAINEAREALYQRWVDNWTGTGAGTFVFDNESAPSIDTAWERISFKNEESEQDTLGPVGSRQFLRQGLLDIRIFTPKDEGLQNADLLGEEARDIYEGASFNGLWTHGFLVREIGPGGNFWETQVIGNVFYREEK